MTEIEKARTRLQKEQGTKLSYLTFFLFATSRVLLNYSEMRNRYYKFFGKSFFNKSNSISGKFTVQKKHQGKRFVVSGLVEDCPYRSLDEIQEKVNEYKELEWADPKMKGIRLMNRLPEPIGSFLFKIIQMPFFKTSRSNFGDFSITSVGKGVVNYILPQIIGTLSLGIGSIQKQNKPNDFVGITLSFDHRVIDGVEATEFLGDFKLFCENKESFEGIEGNE